MQRPWVFGLLLAALGTGLVLGATHEPAARAVPRRDAEDHRPPAGAALERAVVRPGPVEGVAPVQAVVEGSPETSGSAERVRRSPPEPDEEQTAAIRRIDAEYRVAMRAAALDVAAVLEAGPTAQREAVAALRALRDARNRRVRDVLGADAWETRRRFEIDGGRDVQAFLHEMQEGGIER
jgi:hypothetical protein